MDPVKSLFYGALIKMSLTWVLTSLPVLNIRGAALATVIGFGVAALLNLYKVLVLTGMPMRAQDTIIKPLLASSVMGLAVIVLYEWAGSLFAGTAYTNAIATLAAITCGALVYGLMLLLIGGIKREDLETIPRIGPALGNIFNFLRR